MHLKIISANDSITIDSNANETVVDEARRNFCLSFFWKCINSAVCLKLFLCQQVPNEDIASILVCKVTKFNYHGEDMGVSLHHVIRESQKEVCVSFSLQ